MTSLTSDLSALAYVNTELQHGKYNRLTKMSWGDTGLPVAPSSSRNKRYASTLYQRDKGQLLSVVNARWAESGKDRQVRNALRRIEARNLNDVGPGPVHLVPFASEDCFVKVVPVEVLEELGYGFVQAVERVRGSCDSVVASAGHLFERNYSTSS